MHKSILKQFIRLSVKNVFLQLKESVLLEGGNVFDEVNSAVPKKYLDSTIKNALDLAGLYNIKYEVVGNKTKQIFNDIDIAIDGSDIIDEMEPIGDIEDFWAALSEFLIQSDIKDFSINKGLQQFHLLAPLIDQDGKQVNAFTPSGIELDLLGFIQLDVFLGTLSWMKDVNSGAPEESKYKAVYRNVLLAAISSTVKWNKPGSSPDEYYRYSINFRDGLKKLKVKVLPPVGRQKHPQKEILESEIISTDPDELASLLFGAGTNWGDISSFEKLYNLLVGPKYKYKSSIPMILAQFKTNITKKGMALPEEVM